MNAFNINFFLSGTRFSQLTNLSISYDFWSLFNPVTTPVLHLEVHSCLSTDPVLFENHKSLFGVHHLVYRMSSLMNFVSLVRYCLLQFYLLSRMAVHHHHHCYHLSLPVFHFRLKTFFSPTGLIPHTIRPFNASCFILLNGWTYVHSVLD